MDKVRDILTQRLGQAVNALKQSLKDSNRVATGKTRDSIKSTVTVSGSKVVGMITASEVLGIIETGRKATGGQPTGSSVWFDSLREWVRARGLPEESVYPIFKKIHKEGWEGTAGLITDIINEQFVRGLVSEISKVTTDEYTSTIGQNIRAINGINGNI